MTLVLAIVVAFSVVPAKLPATHLNPRIPAPDASAYRPMLHQKEWANPLIIVRPETVELTAMLSTGRTTITMAPDRLRRALVELPLAAWRYGRVVAYHDDSQRTAGAPVTRRDSAVVAERTLTALKIVVERLPA